MTDNKNTILAIVLSAVVLLGWQYFFAVPQEKARQEQLQAQQQKQNVPTPDQPKPAQPQAQSQVPGQATAPSSATPMDRRAALANSPRVPIATDTLQGTIALKGGRIDDLALVKFRETTDPKSPPIVLLSPSGTGDPFYAEFGWTGAAGTNVKLPTSETVWKQVGSGGLGVGRPVTLTYDNGEGLEFRRTISVDDKYLFTIKDDVSNKSDSPVTLFPYALISRHGIPPTAGYYVLHEGLIGVLGESGLQEFTYKNIEDKKSVSWDVTNGWLGITDKYWAATLLPDTSARLKARFSTSMLGTVRTFQTDYLLDAQTIAPGATGSANARLFAGAKEVSIVGINFPLVGIGGYNKELGLNHFDLLIDWGWFYFITKPMFLVMDFFYPPLRQFRPRDPDGYRTGQDRLLPARQQVIRINGEDEGRAAANDGFARALCQRQGQAAAGIDGAVQAGKDQSAGRLPADRDPDPGVFLALQGLVRHHRDAARAVLRLDPRSFGAGSDQYLQFVRAHSARPHGAAADRTIPALWASGRSSWASRCGFR